VELSHRRAHLHRVGSVSISDDDINEQPADDTLAATLASDADGTDSADSDGTDGDGDADGTDGTDGAADGTDGDSDGTDA
jgi:hypothetical protein